MEVRWKYFYMDSALGSAPALLANQRSMKIILELRGTSRLEAFISDSIPYIRPLLHCFSVLSCFRSCCVLKLLDMQLEQPGMLGLM